MTLKRKPRSWRFFNVIAGTSAMLRSRWTSAGIPSTGACIAWASSPPEPSSRRRRSDRRVHQPGGGCIRRIQAPFRHAVCPGNGGLRARRHRHPGRRGAVQIPRSAQVQDLERTSVGGVALVCRGRHHASDLRVPPSRRHTRTCVPCRRETRPLRHALSHILGANCSADSVMHVPRRHWYGATSEPSP